MLASSRSRLLPILIRHQGRQSLSTAFPKRSPSTKSPGTSTIASSSVISTTSQASSYSSTAQALNAASKEPCNRVADSVEDEEAPLPGSRAFVECDRAALIDLFHKYAVNCDVSGRYLDREGLGSILKAVGENPDPETLERLFRTADMNGDGSIEVEVRISFKMNKIAFARC